MIDKALERPEASNPESPFSKVTMHAIYKAVLRATCQRAHTSAMHRTTNQGVVENLDTLDTPFVAGDLDVIDLLLSIRADIKPSMPEVSASSASSDSRLMQLLLDRAENALDPILESVYPRFSEVLAPRNSPPKLPLAMYPAPSSQHENARDIRFSKVLPLAVHHVTWRSVLKRLLDKSLRLNNRDDYMNTALQCACYSTNAETLRILLDWCRDSPLRYESLPGLGYGLVFLARTLEMAMIQEILDSKLNVPVVMFREAYYSSCLTLFKWRMDFERRFLEWAVERSSHDVGFAGDLEFTPTGNIDDQHRLREHLRSKQSLKLHATNWHAMMRSGMM